MQPGWSIPLGWAGLGAILFAAIRFDEATMFPGYVALVPVLGTCLVVAAGSIAPERGVERLLEFGPAQIVGRYSYSLYLWHWPVLVIGAAWAGRDLRIRENLVLLLLAFGLSALTYRLVEKPARDSTWLKARKPAWSIATGAALTGLVLVTAYGSIQSRAVEPTVEIAASGTMLLPNEAQVLAAVEDATSLSEWPEQPPRIANPAYDKECDVSRAATSTSLCVHGDPDGLRVMVVYGDSHAAMWIPALDVIGREQGWQVIQMNKPGCQAPDFPRYSPTMQREYTECGEFRTWALGEIARIQPDLVVISSSSKDVAAWVDGGPRGEGMDQIWADGLRSVVAEIQPNASRIVVVGDMAYPAEPGIDCLTAHPEDVQSCSTPRDEAVPDAMNMVERDVASDMGVGYVDVVPWFCTESTCPAVIGGLTVFRDNFHAAENYAVWLANVLGKAIGVIPAGRDLTAVTLPV
jgi:hypothetical protein